MPQSPDDFRSSRLREHLELESPPKVWEVKVGINEKRSFIQIFQLDSRRVKDKSHTETIEFQRGSAQCFIQLKFFGIKTTIDHFPSDFLVNFALI